MAEDYEVEELVQFLHSLKSAADISKKDLSNGCCEISFTLRVHKPPRGYANGVREFEPIRLLLLPSYPLQAPFIRLRDDFTRNISHLNPSWDPSGKFVCPCIIDEPSDSFLRHYGFGEFIYRLQKWLDDVAFNSLATNDEYWEPMRRDGLACFVTANRAKLLNLIGDNEAGHVALPTYAGRVLYESELQEVFAFVRGYTHLTRTQLTAFLGKNCINDGLTFLLWGDGRISDQYFPDTANSIDALDSQAEGYGCTSVSKILASLNISLQKSKRKEALFFIMILVARRPKLVPNAIGAPSDSIELIPYIGMMNPVTTLNGQREGSTFEIENIVLPFGFRHAVDAELLQSVSGEHYSDAKSWITLLGCGSLGSKIAVHLAKGGFGNFKLSDKGRLSAHNLARLGVLAAPASLGMHKTEALRDELRLLGYDETITSSSANVINDLLQPGGLEIEEHTKLLIDTTASPNVHDALCRGSVSGSDVRILQASFLAGGKIGFLSQEGACRNPDIEDLKTFFWRYWAYADDHKHTIWPDNSLLQRLRIGEGCESLSMVMSDVDASLLSAGITQLAKQSLKDASPSDNGRLSFGAVGEDRCSVRWQHLIVEPSMCCPRQENWDIRILEELVREITDDSQAKGESETGGYLMGRINWSIRRITLAAQLSAPPDSVCTPTYFRLGTEGAREKLTTLYEKSRKSLLALGTWHSHPRGGGESPTDLETVADIAEGFCGSPAISLIGRPEGFKVLIKQSW